MKKKIKRAPLVGFFAGIINGLFGSGGGTVLVPSLVFCMNVEDHKAHATAISVILPISIISSLVYMKHGVVDFPLTLAVSVGSIIGGFVGSTILRKVPVKVLRRFFGIIMIIAAIRMVF